MNYAHPEVLVDTEWVSKNPPSENLKIVEVDYDPENGYRKGHIPGASLIWWRRDINDPNTRDIVNKQQFETLMSKNGIKPETSVVLYGDFNNWFAAFAFWVFKYYGHKDVRIMNGGRKKWELEKRPYTTEEPKIAATSYVSQPPDEGLRAYLFDVRRALDRNEVGLVDVRSPKEFTGEITAPP
ncbi:MAG: rhodanese-like domain-containing protein, partial [Candidatus Nitrosotenuis sp.]